MSIAGFGSLLSIDSARSTFPDLRNFRVRQVCTGLRLSLYISCMHVHACTAQTYLHVVVGMLTLNQRWLRVLQLLVMTAGCRLSACVRAHGADLLPAWHRAARHNGDQQPQLRGGPRTLDRGLGL